MNDKQEFANKLKHGQCKCGGAQIEAHKCPVFENLHEQECNCCPDCTLNCKDWLDAENEFVATTTENELRELMQEMLD